MRSDAEKELIAIALKNLPGFLCAETLGEIVAESLDDYGLDDWTHYVNQRVRHLWPSLTRREKLIAYIAASERLNLGGDRW
jgi:hypothetical protein